MGAQQSSVSELSHNKMLIRFVKDIKIEREDKYWDELINFNFTKPVKKLDSCLLKEATENLCSILVVNNKSSGNLTTLVCICIFYIQNILNGDEDGEKHLQLIEKCENILLIIRCCCQYMVEHLTEEELISHFNTLPVFDGQQSTTFVDFLHGLAEIISFMPVNDHTYHMHLEAVTIQVVLFSIQMYHSKASELSEIFKTVMSSKCSDHSISTVRILFHNYIKNDSPPQPAQSLVGWAASGLMSMIASPTKPHSPSSELLHPLSSHSLLLLLIYVFHFTKGENAYREALFLCKPGKKSEVLEEVEMSRSFPLNFKRLHTALSRDLHFEQTVLLLYILLHKNPSFLKFVLHHKDLEALILPILKVLYNAEQQNAHHIYMALIVILIFTQHEQFNTVVHNLIVTDVAWYTERKLNDITLGSLLVLIILRTIQYNMAKMRDKYLHTNCLASLANMASQFKNLHSLATQKFIMLFKNLIKQYGKLSEKVKETKSAQEEELSDLEVMEEILRMLLEIFNACLCNNIASNTNLIFQLLRYKEIFQSFHLNPKFQDIVQNIDTAISYFGMRVDQSSDTSFSSAQDVIDILKQATESWPTDSLKIFPQLKFKYMEEEAAEDFFVPYIWSIIYKSSFLHWNNNLIRFPLIEMYTPTVSMEKLSAIKIENCWCNHRDRHMFDIMKKAVSSAEQSLSNEMLKRINPREAEMLNDPVFKSKIRFRFAGSEFPPYIVFKIFIETNGRGVKYLCGKTSMKASTEAARDACRLMGHRKYFDQIITDLCVDKQYAINDELDVSNLQDYMKYVAAVDEKSAVYGGKSNSWRTLTLEDVPRDHVIYDIISYMQSYMKLPFRFPLTQIEQVKCIDVLNKRYYSCKEVEEPRRRSRRAQERVTKMKKLYKESGEANKDDNVIAQVEYHTSKLNERKTNMIKDEVNIEDESWDEEGKYLFEWTRNLSLDAE